VKFYVEINEEMLRDADLLSLESCNYNLTGDDVADLREYVEALGYDWNEIAYVWTQVAA